MDGPYLTDVQVRVLRMTARPSGFMPRLTGVDEAQALANLGLVDEVAPLVFVATDAGRAALASMEAK